MGFTAVETKSNEGRDYPKFKDGEEGSYSVGARISLLLDMGIQSRPDFEEDYVEGSDKHENALKRDKNPASLFEEDGKTKIRMPQTDVQQVAVFIDVPSERHNYGDLGEKPYRMLLNQRDYKSGLINGFPLSIVPQRDAKGNIDSSKPKTFASNSKLTKLGKAVGIKSWAAVGNDVTQLLNKPFMATIENKITGSGNVFTKFAGQSPLPEGMPVGELDEEALAISFESAKADQVKFIWKNLREQLKSAKNYEGSQMQAAIQEFESQQNNAPASTPESNMADDMGATDGKKDDNPPF